MTLQQTAVDMLNEALSIDPDATTTLVTRRVVCATKLDEVFKVNYDAASAVGMLGVINGLLLRVGENQIVAVYRGLKANNILRFEALPAGCGGGDKTEKPAVCDPLLRNTSETPFHKMPPATQEAFRKALAASVPIEVLMADGTWKRGVPDLKQASCIMRGASITTVTCAAPPSGEKKPGELWLVPQASGNLVTLQYRGLKDVILGLINIEVQDGKLKFTAWGGLHTAPELPTDEYGKLKVVR